MATGYVVLQEVSRPESPAAWAKFGETIEAASAEAAIRRATRDRDHGGMFVAVPARSWQPLEVKIESTRSVQIGEPGLFSAPEPADDSEPGPDPEGPDPEDELEPAAILPDSKGEVPEGARY